MVDADPIQRLNAALAERYNIERQLGEGGMATVYLAEDVRHKRRVALKVLKPELSAVVGSERFLAEIETTANLQHPHILPLFDSGEADGFIFYVMPYVEGESLRDRLNREHQLPVDDAVRIGTNLAEALDYAHRQGVIHRDIKPANILLQEGKPVIADFGIALAVSKGGGDRITETGLSLGTPHYMSPEQATGDPNVGPPTDIYALGCVLYEMLVGEPPFTGSTPQAVLGRIITGETPSAEAQRASVPPNVDQGIARALEKIPADRFTTALDFADVLSGRIVPTNLPRGAGRSSSPRWLSNALYLGGLLAAVVVTWFVADSRNPGLPPMELAVALPPGQELRSPILRVSSDGSTIVYTGPGETDGETSLWARDWASLEGQLIAGTAGALDFDVSPRNDEVALLSGESIRIQTIASGASRTVAADEAFCCLTWSDDGAWIYFTNTDRGVSRVSPSGGTPETLTTSEGEIDHLWPHPVPGSESVVFELYGLFGIGSKVALLDLDSREYQELGDGSYPTPAGDLVFSTIDERGMQLRYAGLRTPQDAATTIVTDVAWGMPTPDPGFFRPAFDVSATGNLVYARRPTSQVRLSMPVWVERDGTEVPVDSTLIGQFSRVRISPDGSSLLFSATDTIYVKDLPSGPLVPLTRDGTVNYRPSWTPDGSVLYSSNRAGEAAQDIELFRIRPDGASPPEAVGLESASAMTTPDGRWWVYRTSNLEPGQFGDLMALPVDGASEPIPLVATSAREAQPTVSRDGRWFAYSSNISGTRQVYVRPFPEASEGRVQVSTLGGQDPVFSATSNELFFVEGGWMTAVAYETEPTFRETGRERLFDATDFLVISAASHAYDVSADGSRFIMLRLLGEAPSNTRQIVVALDFLRQLEGGASRD